MICCCSMAGTKACDNCINNHTVNKYGDVFTSTGEMLHYTPAPVVKDYDSEYMKIISNLNHHIEDLKEENKMLKDKLKNSEKSSSEES